MKQMTLVLLMTLVLVGPVYAGHDKGEGYVESPGGPACEGFGPQTPRDIDSKHGDNKAVFTFAPAAAEMNLCNIHFHENAEHKAKDFSIYAGDGHAGYDSGYQCVMSKELSTAEMAWKGDGVCKGAHGDLVPGDTIEVHWVHSSCDVQPGPTLGSCLSEKCSNPELRVETQVFTLVAEGGLDFNELKRANDLPTNTGTPVEFTGSTTGPKYNEQACSPYQVTWSVRPQCAKLNINSVGEWCKGNVFNEDHAHGVRKLVTSPQLLSEIK
jgi:hypothetical protein